MTLDLMAFKIGDRVRIYHGWRGSFKGTVDAINKDGLLSVIEDGFYSAHDDAPFHPKQCRLLKKKPKPLKIECEVEWSNAYVGRIETCFGVGLHSVLGKRGTLTFVEKIGIEL